MMNSRIDHVEPIQVGYAQHMYRRFHYSVERASRRLQNPLDVLQRDLDLLFDGAADDLLCCHIDRALTGDENHVAANDAGAVGAFGRIEVGKDDWGFLGHDRTFQELKIALRVVI